MHFFLSEDDKNDIYAKLLDSIDEFECYHLKTINRF